MMFFEKTLLSIETSCDDTSIAITKGLEVKANVISSQVEHSKYGGVIPELASRKHQKNILHCIQLALKEANIPLADIEGVAFTQGPGLIGSLLVGHHTAKAFSQSLKIPLYPIDHIHSHVFSAFCDKDISYIEYPFLSLVVSGGHTDVHIVETAFEIKKIGSTLDDAAGEAFDKCAKLIGYDYPGGALIDAKSISHTNEDDFIPFPIAKVKDFHFSYSGLKTSVKYYLQDKLKSNPNYVAENESLLCFSIQKSIVSPLLNEIEKAIKKHPVKSISVGGGVSCNSYLREKISQLCKKNDVQVFLPEKKYTTDNAAMIGITCFLQKYPSKENIYEIKAYARRNEI